MAEYLAKWLSGVKSNQRAVCIFVSYSFLSLSTTFDFLLEYIYQLKKELKTWSYSVTDIWREDLILSWF